MSARVKSIFIVPGWYDTSKSIFSGKNLKVNSKLLFYVTKESKQDYEFGRYLKLFLDAAKLIQVLFSL